MSLIDLFTNAAKAVAEPAAPIIANATAAVKAAAPAVAAAAGAAMPSLPGLGPAPKTVSDEPTGLAAVKIGWQGGVVIATLFIALIIMGMDLIGPDLVFGFLAALYMVSGARPRARARAPRAANRGRAQAPRRARARTARLPTTCKARLVACPRPQPSPVSSSKTQA